MEVHLHTPVLYTHIHTWVVHSCIHIGLIHLLYILGVVSYAQMCTHSLMEVHIHTGLVYSHICPELILALHTWCGLMRTHTLISWRFLYSLTGPIHTHLHPRLIRLFCTSLGVISYTHHLAEVHINTHRGIYTCTHLWGFCTHTLSHGGSYTLTWLVHAHTYILTHGGSCTLTGPVYTGRGLVQAHILLWPLHLCLCMHTRVHTQPSGSCYTYTQWWGLVPLTNMLLESSAHSWGGLLHTHTLLGFLHTWGFMHTHTSSCRGSYIYIWVLIHRGWDTYIFFKGAHTFSQGPVHTLIFLGWCVHGATCTDGLLHTNGLS